MTTTLASVNKWKWLVSVLGVLFFCLAAALVARSVLRSRDLDETLLWIEQTYNPHEGGDNFGQGYGWEVHYLKKGGEEEVTEKFKMTLTRLGGCNIAINSETFPEGVYRDTPGTDKFTINLCDIDPESIKVRTFDLHRDVFDCSDPEQVRLYALNCQNAEIVFLTRNSATAIDVETITTFVKLTGKDHELKRATKTNKCWLFASDVSYAERLTKALKHAVELCGGKASKF